MGEGSVVFFGMRLEYWSLIISLIAILFTALKDFIIPRLLRPKLQFTYYPKEPYKRAPVVISPGIIGFFDRVRVENIGRDIAKNCRCQIYSIENSEGKSFDFHGFPLRWGSRPESAIDFIKAERLNIAPGESEFIDLAYFRSDVSIAIQFNKYHNVPIGIPDNLPLDNYKIQIIVSGENFKPYIIALKILKKTTFQGLAIHLLGVKRKW